MQEVNREILIELATIRRMLAVTLKAEAVDRSGRGDRGGGLTQDHGGPGRQEPGQPAELGRAAERQTVEEPQRG